MKYDVLENVNIINQDKTTKTIIAINYTTIFNYIIYYWSIIVMGISIDRSM